MSCGRCGGQITDEKTVALGRDWHKHCFTCTACGSSLPGEFFAKDGAPYCKADYFQRFLNQCAQCHQPIEGREVIKEGRHYHEMCFTCAGCHKPCDKAYFVKGGNRLCPNCNVDENVRLKPAREEAGHCGVCYKQLEQGEDSMLVNGQRYHQHCFKCEHCRRPIGPHEDYHPEEVSSKLTKACCNNCFETRAEKCYGCGGPILTGTSTSALGRRYHLQCFKCDQCHRPLPKGEMFVNDGGRIKCDSCGK
eukprot:TRINITY_DN815_c0_g1_i1.p2 TRINITY_DN815_c0_g1~~TRINITY_DN815_c0_g1_i1.p2  ORF type:complete len:274 (-),score=33.03 TRINITY_DN815_c0_g1_i1:140-886(-)